MSNLRLFTRVDFARIFAKMASGRSSYLLR